jgi:hypothetical protein
MSLTLWIRPEAEADLAEAYRWYEQQRPGLGEALLTAVDATLAGVERHPETYPLVEQTARRALTRRFP